MKCEKYYSHSHDFLIFPEANIDLLESKMHKVLPRKKGIGADALLAKADDEVFILSDLDARLMELDAASVYLEHLRLRRELSPKPLQVGSLEVLPLVKDQALWLSFLAPKVENRELEWDVHHFEYLFLGVPHVIAFVKDLGFFDQNIGRRVSGAFNTNVSMALVEGGFLHVRSFEQDANKEVGCSTLAAVAAFILAYKKRLVEDFSQVKTASGEILNVGCSNGKIFFKVEVKKTFETIYNF